MSEPSTLDAVAAPVAAAAPSAPQAEATKAPASAVEPAASEAPKAPGAAAQRLAEIRERRAAKADAAAKAKAAKAGVDPLALEDAARWRAHEASQLAQIADAAKALDDSDRALLDAVPGIEAKARLLARLQAAAKASDAPVVAAKAKPLPGVQGQPVTSVDFASAMKSAESLADAKAKDPAGWSSYFSSLLNGSGRKSTLDAAWVKPAKG